MCVSLFGILFIAITNVTICTISPELLFLNPMIWQKQMFSVFAKSLAKATLCKKNQIDNFV